MKKCHILYSYLLLKNITYKSGRIPHIDPYWSPMEEDMLKCMNHCRMQHLHCKSHSCWYSPNMSHILMNKHHTFLLLHWEQLYPQDIEMCMNHWTYKMDWYNLNSLFWRYSHYKEINMVCNYWESLDNKMQGIVTNKYQHPRLKDKNTLTLSSLYMRYNYLNSYCTCYTHCYKLYMLIQLCRQNIFLDRLKSNFLMHLSNKLTLRL